MSEANVTFDQIQNAERAIYAALRPLSKPLRDRILRHVQEALASERVPLRMVANFDPNPTRKP